MAEKRRSVRQRSASEKEGFEQASRRRRDSRRKKRLGGGLITAAVILALLGAGAFYAGKKLQEKYAPSKVQKDLNEWFEVSGNEVRIYLDEEADRQIKGRYMDKDVYLPLNWIRSNLNKRFFWNEKEALLTMTLPDEIMHFDRSSKAPSGASALRSIDGKEYIALSLVRKYTDINVREFCSDEFSAKRLYFYHSGFAVKKAAAQKDTFLRTKGDIKGDVLCPVGKGEEVIVLDEYQEWSRVSSASGIHGYVKNEEFSSPSTYKWPKTYELPEPERRLLQDKTVMAWHLVTNPAGNQYFDEYYGNTGGAVNVICPTWLQIEDAGGNLADYTSETYMEKAHAAGLEVWAVVDNFNQPGGLKDFSTRDFFRSRANREKFIADLMEKAETYGYDGLNLDFEGIPSDAGESYAEFYRELSVACHQRGLILSIDNYVPYSFNDFYDIEEQGLYADYVVVMGYDEHTYGSAEAGSVSSIGYTGYGIREACRKVPSDRVINGIPLYTRLWKDTGLKLTSEVLSMKEMEQLTEANGYKKEWDRTTGQYYCEKKTSDGTLKCWMEEERSVKEKMKLIREYDLAGVAAWRLGYEPASIWKVIRFDEEQ